MTLKKTNAGYFDENKLWHEQEEIELHPLEEQETLTRWAIGDCMKKVISEPTQKEEHDWLIEFGADYVKKKRQEYIDSCEAIKPELEKLQKIHEEANNKWLEHVEMCVANSLNPDTFNKDS